MNQTFLLSSTALLLSCHGILAAPVPEGPAIVERHAIAFKAPARRVPTGGMVDGPLLGNGAMGVVQGGTPDALRFYIGKNDFWTAKSASGDRFTLKTAANETIELKPEGNR